VARVLRARTSFVAVVGSTKRLVGEGQLISAADPVVRGREKLFETPEAHAARLADAAKNTRARRAAPAAPPEA
jgi:hypothetical protein